MAINISNGHKNRQNGHKLHTSHHLPLQGPNFFTQIGSKIYQLATPLTKNIFSLSSVANFSPSNRENANFVVHWLIGSPHINKNAPVASEPVFFLYFHQGCQTVYFQTKNPDLGQFWKALYLEYVDICIVWPFRIFYEHLGYFTNIWDILRTFGIFYEHLGYFITIWYILC
jgi:hypothetical protein